MPKTETAKITPADLFKGDLKLTSSPTLFFELKRVVEDPNKSMADVGNIIVNDPALTMSLLKILLIMIQINI